MPAVSPEITDSQSPAKRPELRPIGEVIQELTGWTPSLPSQWRLRKEPRGGVVLEAYFANGTWCTTRELYLQYLRASSAARSRKSNVAVVAQKRKKRAKKLAKKTDAKLKAEGLLV